MSSGREVMDLRERVAVAIRTADLTPTGPAAEVVGAMGAASVAHRYDAAIGRSVPRVTAMDTPVLSEKGRLSALLERAKFGLDRSARHAAVVLFAPHLGTHRAFCDRLKIKRGSPLLLSLAGIVVAEWIADRCPQCGGAGRVAVEGRAARNARTEICRLCNHSGRPEIEHASRARALGVPMTAYEARWKPRIDEAKGWLLEIETSGIQRLQSQMRRGTLHPVAIEHHADRDSARRT